MTGSVEGSAETDTGTHETDTDNPDDGATGGDLVAKFEEQEHQAQQAAEQAQVAADKANADLIEAKKQAQRTRFAKLASELSEVFSEQDPDRKNEPAADPTTVDELTKSSVGGDGKVNQYGVVIVEDSAYVDMAEGIYGELDKVDAGEGLLPQGSGDDDGGGGGGGGDDGDDSSDDDSPPMSRLNVEQVAEEARSYKRILLTVALGSGGLVLFAGAIIGIAALAGGFKSSSDENDKNSSDENDAPVAPDLTLAESARKNRAEIDVWDGTTPVTDPDGDDQLDKTSLVFVGFDTDNKTQKTVPAGVWSYNTGNSKITFTPSDTFDGGAVSVKYTVADKDGLRSNEATLTVTYPSSEPTVIPPQAFELISDKQPSFAHPVTLNAFSGDFGDKPKPGTNDIDIQKVYLVAMMQVPMEPPPPPGVVSTDKQSLVVKGEGEWMAATGGDISFTPEEGFVDSPSPILYQIADVNGTLSNQAAVVINADLKATINAFGALNDIDDVQFWDRYKTVLTDPESKVDLPVFYAVTRTLYLNTLNAMDDTDRQLVVDEIKKNEHRVVGQITTWVTSGATPLALFNLLSQITDSTVPSLKGVKNGTRAARLGQMLSVIETYFVTLQQAQPTLG